MIILGEIISIIGAALWVWGITKDKLDYAKQANGYYGTRFEEDNGTALIIIGVLVVVGGIALVVYGVYSGLKKADSNIMQIEKKEKVERVSINWLCPKCGKTNGMLINQCSCGTYNPNINTAETNNLYCIACGAKTSADAKFCKFCGARIEKGEKNEQ